MMLFNLTVFCELFLDMPHMHTPVLMLRTIIKWVIHYFSGCMQIFILANILYLIKNRWLHNIISYSIISICGVLFISDIFLFCTFCSVLDQVKIEAVMAADPFTTKEFFSAYGFSLSTAAIFVVLTILIYLYYKTTRHFFFVIRRGYIILVIISIVSTVFLGVKAGVLLGTREFVLSVFYRSFAIERVMMDTWLAYLNIGNEREIYAVMDRQSEAILENYSDTPYVIFVLGESTDRNAMGVYGYKNDTTPYLSRRNEDKEVIVFNDVISAANYTTKSMQLIFSFANKENDTPWYWYPNLIDIVKKAGYHTSWLSNQSPVAGIGTMDNILAKRSDESFFTINEGGANQTESRTKDGELLPLLDEQLKNISNKNFIVLHLEGTHPEYKLRYPPEFSKFTENDEVGEKESWRKIKAEYDNAVLYNDYILNEIIKRFENRNAVIIYVSDHGNEVCDGRDFFGHSSEESGNRHMIEVPMFIWGSKIFWKQNPELKVAARKAKDNPFRSDDIIHFILGVMKIRTESYDATRNIISSKYNKNRPRIYNGKEYVKY